MYKEEHVFFPFIVSKISVEIQLSGYLLCVLEIRQSKVELAPSAFTAKAVRIRGAPRQTFHTHVAKFGFPYSAVHCRTEGGIKRAFMYNE